MSNKFCFTYDSAARIEEERSHLKAGERHGKRGSYDVYEHPKHGQEKLLTRFLGSRVWETFEEAKKAMDDGGEEGQAVYKVRADYVKDTQPARDGKSGRHLLRWAELVDI
jgi:hypothetical protein